MDPQEVVLVTGANTGLGFQIIRALCGSNKAYNILLAGRSLVKAQQAARSATEDFPSSRSKLWPIQVDIEDDDSVQRAFDEVQIKFGRLDALVNNAGMDRTGRGKVHPQYLTDHRRTARPTTRLRAHDNASDVEPILER
jgi:NAD(P)-dependent dehydrogenase (short-subunit alcohol dehydrogenase family)